MTSSSDQDDKNLSKAAKREPDPGPHLAEEADGDGGEHDQRLFQRGSFLETSRISGVLRAETTGDRKSTRLNSSHPV